MKKILAALIVLGMVFCFCVPVSAAPGGTYRIEEAKTNITIPEGWMVYTRNAIAGDPDVEWYGGLNVILDEMKAGGYYLIAMHKDGAVMTMQMMSDVKEFQKIPDLTKLYAQASSSDQAKYIESIKSGVSKGGGTFTSMYQSDEGNKKNNYWYIAATGVTQGIEKTLYMTVVDAKLVGFAYYRLDGKMPTESEKAIFRNVIATVHYDNGFNHRANIGAKEIKLTKFGVACRCAGCGYLWGNCFAFQQEKARV